jgi:hypothetical protein
MFASRTVDHSIVVWAETGDELTRYSHPDGITALDFNSADMQLASGSVSELAIWSPASRLVTRCKA